MSSIELGSVIVDALVGMGATDVVLAPGSRSAPLALALDRADKAGSLRLHVRIDERVAAFTALGLAKESGRAVAVVTTSGTAVANLAPAMMEAEAAGVPLIAITADRPAFYVGTGASQTTDQVGVFGPSALAVIRLSSSSGRADAWAAAVYRAVVIAEGRRTRRRGPVQLNVEFGVPLVGELPAAEPRGIEVARSRPADVTELDGRRTVVLVGDATPEQGAEARALAELSGAPLLAEPSSNARAGANAIAAYRHLLDGVGEGIERVICFGHQTLTRPVTALLRRDGVEVVVVADGALWPDVSHRALIIADRVALEPQDDAWLAAWREADVEWSAAHRLDVSAQEPVADVRGLQSVAGRDLDQQAVADSVLASLGAEHDLVVGSSSIIRALDLSPVNPTPPRVYANRGLAGIDGTLATAMGLALSSGRPTTLILGDLTMQHDLGSLARPASEPRADVRVVVADDNGGSIFHTLEQGAPEYADSFERVFGTPQDVDLVAVADAMGWDAVRVSTREELDAALASRAEFIVASVPRG